MSFPKFVMKGAESYVVGNCRRGGGLRATKTGNFSVGGLGCDTLSDVLKALLQFPGFARMVEWIKGSGGSIEWSEFAERRTGGDVEGLSQRSLTWGIILICGQLAVNVDVKWSKSKRWLKGRGLSEGALSSGSIKFVAVHSRQFLLRMVGVEG
jgi:hypothetical protein